MIDPILESTGEGLYRIRICTPETVRMNNFNLSYFMIIYFLY